MAKVTRIDWSASGRALASRLLASGVSPFQLADLRYRLGALSRALGPALSALGAPPGEEGRVPGVWATHVDGTRLYLTDARRAAENAFNAGWDAVVEAALAARTRDQRLPGAGGEAEPARLDFLIALGLDRGCTTDDVRRAYRERAHAAHPDAGGAHDLFVTLARARDAALAWIAARDGRRGP